MRQLQKQHHDYEPVIKRLVLVWLESWIKDNGLQNGKPYDLLGDLILSGQNVTGDKGLETLRPFLESRDLVAIARRVVLEIISQSCLCEIEKLKPKELKLCHVLAWGYRVGQRQ